MVKNSKYTNKNWKEGSLRLSIEILCELRNSHKRKVQIEFGGCWEIKRLLLHEVLGGIDPIFENLLTCIFLSICV